MPKRTTIRRKTRRMRGGRKTGGLFGWLKGAHDFIKKHKIISRLGKAYSMTGLPMSGPVGTAAGVAGTLGYGRSAMMGYSKKRRTRSSIVMRRKYAGGALVPAGK